MRGVVELTTKICTRGRSTRDHSQGFVTDPHACLLARASFLPWRRGIGSTLERHPFSGLAHSAGELLHLRIQSLAAPTYDYINVSKDPFSLVCIPRHQSRHRKARDMTADEG